MKNKITGNDLIALGLKPGKWMKEALLYINSKPFKDDELMSYLEQFRMPEPIWIKL